MTVATTGNKFSYSGDGVTVAFSFPRLFLSDGDLKVIVKDAGGVETVQTLTTHYTVTGAEDPAGGTVTMVTPPASGETLVLVRRTAQSQETDYVTGGAFSADGHEDALDKLTLQVQDLQEQVDRALKLQETSTTATPAFPEPAAGKAIGWNGTATALENIAPVATTATFPGSAVDENITVFDGVTGIVLKDGGKKIADLVALTGAQIVAGIKTFTDNIKCTADIIKDVATGKLTISGGNGVAIGANHRMFGSAHATQASDHEFRTGSTIRAMWDQSQARWDYRSHPIVGVTSLTRNTDNGSLFLSGDIVSTAGANAVLYGSAHSTKANDIEFRAGAAVKAQWDDSAGNWSFLSGVFQVDAVKAVVSGNLKVTGTISEAFDTADLRISGGTTDTAGGQIRLYGQSHATQAEDIEFRTGASSVRLSWDESAARWNFADNDAIRLGNVAVGGSTFGASATNTLHIENGTAPTGNLANGVMLYAEDVTASSELKVRNEAGTITQLSSHGFEQFTPDLAERLPWSVTHANPYLGVENNVDMAGAIRAVEELARQAGLPVTKFIHQRSIASRSWTSDKLAEAAVLNAENTAGARAEWDAQVAAVCETELEITRADAVETVAVVEAVASGNKLSRHRFNPETGDVETFETDELVEQDTGRTETRLKDGVRLDQDTGTFQRCHTHAEAEAVVGPFVPPATTAPKPPPAWIAARLARGS